ncbi:MAG: hypothetical protein P8N76_20185 [Pirellulaceae bacterium]|nr:hypothetical protein [Pirellulaceae bacterium]
MKKLVILVWLLLPVLVGAYHLGPGQKQVIIDRAGQAARIGDQMAQNDQWAQAIAQYDLALELLPEGHVADAQQLRLAKAKAQMFDAQLPAARQDLQALVDELSDDSSADHKLLNEARESLANSQYYTTWLMRLEGQPKEVWQPEIESSRQIYKLLAEDADQFNEKQRKSRHQEDLESSIRLARMDLKDLQGLPLPSQ